MRFIILTLIALCSLPANADERYEIKSFDSYLVPLLSVVDNESSKTGWGSVVSRPYGGGAGVVPHLERMVRKWNKRGIRPEDERNLEIRLKHLGMFTFPATANPAGE